MTNAWQEYEAYAAVRTERDALAKEVKRLRGLLMADVMQGPDAPGPDEAVRDG